MALITAFILYCGLFNPSWLSWFPQTGIMSALLVFGGMCIIVFGAYRSRTLGLLLAGLVLSSFSELIVKPQTFTSSNPMLVIIISELLLLVGILFMGAGVVVGIRNNLRSQTR